MNIAFDVKGTLEDTDQEAKVWDLLKRLHDAGHSIYIWSSLRMYANKTLEKVGTYGRKAKAIDKYSKLEAEEGYGYGMMDIAFEDDHSQTYLAAKRFVWVDEIPRDLEAYEKFAKELVQSLK